MAWDLGGKAGDALDFEDGLGLSRQRDRGLEGVGDAVASEEAEEVGRVLVDDDVGARDVDAETVGEEVFFVAA